jgi:hypothetical protein
MNLCTCFPHLLSDVDENQCKEGHTFLKGISEMYVCGINCMMF